MVVESQKSAAKIDQFHHPISVDVKIKVSSKCPIIGEQVMIIFVT